jgi:hypothetical protein
MTLRLITDDRPTLVCKHLVDLPPVVSDWQQACQQPRCPYYRQGECCNPGRQWRSAPCPFDGWELPLEDADATADSQLLTFRRVRQRRMAFDAR